MPNQANKSKDNSGIVQKKRKPTVPAIDKQGTEGNATKKSKGKKAQNGDTGSPAKDESQTAASNTRND